jgi:hypothetical protein
VLGFFKVSNTVLLPPPADVLHNIAFAKAKVIGVNEFNRLDGFVFVMLTANLVL